MQTDDDGELTFVETTPAADDVIEGRSPRPPARWAVHPWWLVALLLAVLAAGVGIGYVLGRHTSKAPTAPGTPTALSSSPAAAVPRLQTTGDGCSARPPGTRRLLLATKVQNGATVPMQLHYVRGIFPMGGLRTVDAAVGDCGDPGVPVPDYWLAPGDTVWLRITVDVLVRCPQPLPVHYQVDYSVNGAATSVTLASFPDLGSVPWSGC